MQVAPPQTLLRQRTGACGVWTAAFGRSDAFCCVHPHQFLLERRQLDQQIAEPEHHFAGDRSAVTGEAIGRQTALAVRSELLRDQPRPIGLS